MDSSRVSTFLISMLLIVYGSFRSLNMEEEQRLKKKEENLDENDKSKLLSSSWRWDLHQNSVATIDSASLGPSLLVVPNYLLNDVLLSQTDVQTLDSMQALLLPLGASISLLIMFFFFDSLSILFAFVTASKFRTECSFVWSII